MTDFRLTMELDPELKNWLETEARRQDRSAAHVAKQAIHAMKNRSEAKARMIREAIAEAERGVFISEQKMTDWFESLDTDTELPEPEPDILLHRS